MKSRLSFAIVICAMALALISFTAIAPAASAQIQVLSADPPAAEQGTVNLNVLIKGKGFKRGAVAKWFVTGTTDPGGVRVNSTAFVDATTLRANIDVADTAVLSKYDIVVRNSDGRTGKGIEMFSVTAKGSGNQASCPVLPPLLAAPNSCSSTSPGCLDITFGGTGVVLTDITAADYHIDSDGAFTPLLQPDGKLVAVGQVGCTPGNTIYSCPSSTGKDFAAARYNIDGSLDATFGIGGIARDAVTSGDDNTVAGALQPDGKILIAGYSAHETYASVARLNPDGTLDATFGSGGNVLLAPPRRSLPWYAAAIALQSDGKILLGMGDSGAVVRLNPNGSLDNTFGKGGVLALEGMVLAVATQWVTAGGVAQERILVADKSSGASGGQDSDFLLMRLMPSGALDTSFGTGGTGKTYTDFCGGYDTPRSIAFDATGNIVLAGTAQSQQFDAAIARYTSDGVLDTTLGDPVPGSTQRSGKSRVDFFGGDDSAWSVLVQADGKLVIGGIANVPDPYAAYFAVARFNSDGSLDTSFGSGGAVATDYGTPAGKVYGRRAVLLGDGKIVVVGAAAANNTFNFAVARYWP